MNIDVQVFKYQYWWSKVQYLKFISKVWKFAAHSLIMFAECWKFAIEVSRVE